jgi:hypothetical protein
MLNSDDKRYDYNRFGSKDKRVGQAVSDMMSVSNAVQMTAGDVLEAYQGKFVKELEQAIKDNMDKYEDPFYILVITKKEHWAANVVRNYFIARQTKPNGLDMVTDYANHTKTLYKVNKHRGNVDIMWSLPGFEEMKTVLNHPETYDPTLVKWITDCFGGNLDKD